jgi:hypothetical protein
VFRGHASSFYKHVRCGILHQGETTGGWHIHRKNELFNTNTKHINATAFHDALEVSLEEYCSTLKSSDWSQDVWKNLRKKMKTICDNCTP